VEVLEARKIMRQSRILLMEENHLKCLGGEDALLNPEFKNFLYGCERNCERFMTVMLKGEKTTLPLVVPFLGGTRFTDINVYRKQLKRKVNTLPSFLKKIYLDIMSDVNEIEEPFQIELSVDSDLADM
jgi:hypothetical protein